VSCPLPIYDGLYVDSGFIRSHGEFVYSLRSILRAFHPEEIAGLHLVTTDLPRNTTGGMRVGQVPTWLNLESHCIPHIYLHHHSQIFKLRGQEARDRDAATWREHVLPSFNSIGIESQLVTLAPELTDTILYVRRATILPIINQAHVNLP
jgi:hypothetical protein